MLKTSTLEPLDREKRWRARLAEYSDAELLDLWIDYKDCKHCSHGSMNALRDEHLFAARTARAMFDERRSRRT